MTKITRFKKIKMSVSGSPRMKAGANSARRRKGLVYHPWWLDGLLSAFWMKTAVHNIDAPPPCVHSTCGILHYHSRNILRIYVGRAQTYRKGVHYVQLPFRSPFPRAVPWHVYTAFCSLTIASVHNGVFFSFELRSRRTHLGKKRH